jgi:hypothetical protein
MPPCDVRGHPAHGQTQFGWWSVERIACRVLSAYISYVGCQLPAMQQLGGSRHAQSYSSDAPSSALSVWHLRVHFQLVRPLCWHHLGCAQGRKGAHQLGCAQGRKGSTHALTDTRRRAHTSPVTLNVSFSVSISARSSPPAPPWGSASFLLVTGLFVTLGCMQPYVWPLAVVLVVPVHTLALQCQQSLAVGCSDSSMNIAWG